MSEGQREMVLKPIGVIHTEFVRQEGTPIQGAFARGHAGWVEVGPEYAEGLKDLDGFDRVWLIYWLHDARAPRLTVTPFLDKEQRGVFSTRAPSRPNPIGLTCVRLTGVRGNRVDFEDADMLDGTPLLDIKPYSPRFDVFDVRRSGWLDGLLTERETADDRFVIPDDPRESK